jgi:predicted transcriptional regulator
VGVMTFRLDEKLEREVRRLAALEGRTNTELVCEALTAYVAQKEARRRGLNVADAMKDYIGAARGGRRLRSQNARSKILESLIAKKKAGRL